jgi:hypothetical protein
LGNVVRGSVSLYHEEPIGILTALENRGSGITAGSAGRNLQASTGGILDLEGTGEIVHNGRDKLVLDVVSHRATRGAEETSVEIGSEVGVTGEGSAVMFVITIRVEVFFNVDDFGFLMIMVIVSTLVFKSVVEGKETDENEAC